MTTRGEINSNFYQIVDVDAQGNPTLVKPQYIGNIPNANTANYANYAGNAFSVTGSNVVGAVNNALVAGTANSVAVANVVGIGNIATINLDGDASNILYGNGVFAPITSAPVSNANYANFAGNAFSVTGSNVVGDVAGADHANLSDLANSVAVANVVGIGNIATINLDGNVSNVLFGDGSFGPGGGGGNSANANYANFAGNAFSVDGANVVGDVSGANHANIADAANSVAVANVVGIGNIATSNFDGNGSNALLGNGVFGSIVVTSVANANYSNFAGQVVNSAQSNITSVGTLASLSVLGTTSLSSNLNMNGNWVTNIGYAVVDTDAASKLYVDTLVSTGISYHQPVQAATTVTLSTATSGTTAYNQPNGAGNGIGAYISTTGTFATIDGVTINGSTSTRILVKDEANSSWNGVYNYTNATAITRTTDTDEYGIGSTEKIGINDYFFTQAGTVNKGSGFIVSAPAGTITFGTSNIEFSIFSTSQIYTGGTGITVSGTVISANASQTQVTAVGTLTSLSVTGNVNAGNIIASRLISNVATGTAPFTVTSTTQVSNLTVAFSNVANVANSVAGGNVSGQVANALIAGTVYTGSQPNITSLGTLGSLSVVGFANASRFVSSIATGTAPFIVASSTEVANLTAAFSNIANIATVANTVALSGASPNSTRYLTFASTAPGPDGLGISFGIKVNPSLNKIFADYFSGDGSNLTGVTANPAGSNTQIQFNDGGLSGANASLTFDKTTGVLTTSILNSTVTTGTAPFTVASTTQVSNLRSAFSNVANTANSVAVANVVGIGNIATSNFDGNGSNALLGNGIFGAITVSSVANANYAAYAGNITIAAQPNITSLGTLTSLSVTANIDSGYINANGIGLSSLTGANVTGTVGSATVAGTVTTAAQPNITSLGILTSLSVSGNINAGYINANGIGLTNITAANVVGEVANANYAGYAGNVTIAAQSNITSVGTLASLSVSGSATLGNVISTGLGNVANVLFTKYNETVVAGGSVSGTLTPNAAAGTIYNYTLTGSITLNSLSNAVAGTGMTVILTQGGSGSYTLTSTMKFLGGTKTLSTSVGAIDIVSIFYDGTTYYATLGKGFA